MPARSRETWSVTSMRKNDWTGLDHAGQGGQVRWKRPDPICGFAPEPFGSWKYCVVPSFRKRVRGIQACLLSHSAHMSTEFIACNSLNSPGKPVSWAIISLCPAQLGARKVHIVRGTQLVIPGVRICPRSTQSLGSIHYARLPLPYSGPTAACVLVA